MCPRRTGSPSVAGSHGTAALTGALWRGRAVLRCSMSNWATTPEDIDRTVAAIARLAATAGTTA